MAAPATEERRTVRAQVRYARVSAYKVREVLGLIRGKSVREAEEALVLTERDPAQVVLKCLRSAAANAEHNDQIDESELFVSECYSDEGPTLKRWRPRARGRATRIRKRTCHVTVVLARYTPDELAAIEDRENLKGSGGRRDAAEDRRRRVAKSKGEEAEETTADEDGVDETDDTSADDATEIAEETTSSDEAVTDESAADESDGADADAEAGEEGAESASADSGDAPTAEQLVDDNSKDDLLKIAEDEGVDVAKSATKPQIAAAIVAARTGENDDEGEA